MTAGGVARHPHTQTNDMTRGKNISFLVCYLRLTLTTFHDKKGIKKKIKIKDY